MAHEELLLWVYGSFGLGATLLLCYLMLRDMLMTWNWQRRISRINEKVPTGLTAAPAPTRSAVQPAAPANKKVPAEKEREHVRT